MEIAPESLSQFFADIAPELDERRRRILYGATARLLGRGGITEVSRAAGISRNTVAAGAAEIRDGDLRPPGQVRRPGAGRKSAADRQPQLLQSLRSLLAREGQPGDSPLEWTLLSSYEIAAELRRQGFAISPSGAAQLMRDLGYFAAGRARPASERKRAELRRHYRCLSQAVAAFGAGGQPVVCVRANRSELATAGTAAGGPATGGTADGTAGDDQAGGWVRVGPDQSVVSFTAEAVQRWWAEVSPRCFPAATEVLICTDTFAADGEIRDAWKHQLARLAHATGLNLTVQGIPQGAWRWRGHEAQYSYAVTQTPHEGRPVRCQVTIDLITAPGPAGPAGSPAAGGRCSCRYTARPSLAVPAKDSRAACEPGLSDWSAEGPRGQRDLGANGRPGAHPAGPHPAAPHPAAPRAPAGAVEPRKPKIAEVVAHNIARDISTRRLRPGNRLPSETVALTRFSVSRSSLREALRMLELLGVIRIRTGAGGGPVVGQVTSADFGSTTTFYYHLIGVTIREILEARCILEPALVRLAVDQTDPTVKGRLRGFMNRLGGDDPVAPAWRTQRERSRTAGFHWALIETGNGVLDLFSHSLQDVWMARQTMEPFPEQVAAHHDRDHWTIAQAILNRDGGLAESLMRTHMDYLYDFANAHWSGLLDEVIDWHLPKAHLHT
jgi:DNA-binding FadR family transcriptional regulator